MRNLNWQPLAALSLVMLAGCGDDTASSPTNSADVAAFEKFGRTPALSFTASPLSITSGASSSLTWSSTGASSCAASGGWSGTLATSGTRSVTPAATTTYTVTCRNSRARVSRSLQVAVGATTAPPPPAAAPAPSVAMTATPASITTGSSSSLAWTSSNATSCAMSGGVTASEPLNGTVAVAPSATSTYTLTCTGSGGSAASSATVTVTAPAAPPPPTTTPTTPTTTATTYPGFTYHLPATRPFISLDAYAGASTTSPAYTRLKAQVDDVVAVTNALPAGSTYSQLVSALNSGHYGYSSVDSVIMYRLTGNTAYIDQAIKMVDLFVKGENALINAGQQPVIAGDSYLEVGQYMAELALAYDFGYARLTATQKAEWSAYAEQAIYNVWNPNSARWGSTSRPWSGWSIRDPGNNYFYSFMRATQLWALASQNPTWITYLQTNVYNLVVPFFSVLDGGGSREGTGYGTAIGNLFENYLYWKPSTGEDLSGYTSHARQTIDYWVHATVPTFQYFAPIGDQSRSSMPIMFDYQRKLVLTGVALNPGTAEARRGAWWLKRAQLTDGGNGWVTGQMRYNFNYRFDLLATAGTEEAPTALTYDATGTGALFSRSDWGTTASWLATNAGPYDQSHAHQDQGSFSFFRGKWLAVTSNVLSNSGINQGTEVHNVVRFDVAGKPVGQNNAVSTKTVSDTSDVLQVVENLTPAYSRSASYVSSWQRDLTYRRSTHNLVVHDRCTVASTVTPVWQLHTPAQPVRQTDGSYLAGTLRITPQLPAAPTVSIVAMPTVSADFSGGYRLELRGPAGSCEFTVSLTAE